MSEKDVCWNCGLPESEHVQVMPFFSRVVPGDDPPVLICPISVYEPSRERQDRLRAMAVTELPTGDPQ